MKTTITSLAALLIAFGAMAQSAPTSSAPTPTDPSADVISMFSDAYTDVTVDTWLTPWSAGATSDTAVGGNNIKKYSSLDFAGIETVTMQIDASGMNTFHIDAWTPNMTELRIKLVDFGANGVFDGPGVGDDVEHEVTIPNPALSTWNEYDFPLSNFAGLTTTSNIAQMIISGFPTGTSIVYVDNIYFSNQAGVAPAFPSTAAATPTEPAGSVVSMFSDAYTDVPVDTWQTPWSSATFKDTSVTGNPIKCYTGLDFVGVEAVTQQIDASSMNTFHFDIWTPNMTQLRVKLVDFGPDGAFQGGDDTEHEIIFPNPGQNTWVGYDIPLSSFTGLTTTSNIAQLIFAGDPPGLSTLYVDNVYFSAQTSPFPATAAPTPTDPAGNVISMFSDAYTDVPVDTWQTVWSQASFKDTVAAGNPIKCYSNLNFVGIETVASQIDASGTNTFHFDAWTPNMTELRVKLVDFGPDGAFQGGDDTEHEIVFANPAQNNWNEYDIPLSNFVGLTTTSNIAQLIFSGNPSGAGSLYIDNVYFSTQASVFPQSAAPTPTQSASDVISMFSNAYTDVPVDTWQTVWSQGTLTDTDVNGNDIKCYTGLNFVGIETVAQQIDASSMTTFHFDAWTPNITELRVKLVDFGPDGAFQGGDDTEHEIVYPAPAQNSWVEFDIPLSDFTGLVNTNNIAQLIFAGSPAGAGTVYVDNVYFSNDPVSAGTELAMKVFLQGPLNGTLMNDDLRVSSLIPSTDPYPGLGFSYEGSGWSDSFDPNVLNNTGNDAIVDWVVVDMYPDAAVGGNTAARYSRPALLQRDGDVVNLDGTSPLSLNMPAGTYNAAVRHRNHLGAIVSNSAVYGSGVVSVDLTTTGGDAVGTEALYINGSTRALWAGDSNFDAQVKYTGGSNDRDVILVEIGGSIPTNTSTGYTNEDINMDGVVKYTGSSNDRDIILQVIGGSVPTNVRNQVGF